MRTAIRQISPTRLASVQGVAVLVRRYILVGHQSRVMSVQELPLWQQEVERPGDVFCSVVYLLLDRKIRCFGHVSSCAKQVEYCLKLAVLRRSARMQYIAVIEVSSAEQLVIVRCQ